MINDPVTSLKGVGPSIASKLERRGIRTVLDLSGADPEEDRICRELGISHMEWLVNLEDLIGLGEFEFFGVPLRFKGGSGSPIRAFAIVDD